MRFVGGIVLAGVAMLFTGCVGGESHASGTAALMRVQAAAGSQFVEGALSQMPSVATPAVLNINTQNNTLYPGIQGKVITGVLSAGGTAVLVGLAGDAGYWVVPVEIPTDEDPTQFSFSLRASFSPTLRPGSPECASIMSRTEGAQACEVQVIYRAVSANGDVGPAETRALTVEAVAPAGALVITLEWDTEADLDLRVLAPTPSGSSIEIWSRKRDSLIAPAPGDPAPSDEEVAAAGRLDFDSNSQCQPIDGLRQESVYWPVAPAPSGHYVVRVDTFSLCGQPAARWHATATLDGTGVIAEAYGRSGDTDTRGEHGGGAGLQAFVFDLL